MGAWRSGAWSKLGRAFGTSMKSTTVPNSATVSSPHEGDVTATLFFCGLAVEDGMGHYSGNTTSRDLLPAK